MKIFCITSLLLFAMNIHGQKTFNKHIGINLLGQRPVPEIITLRNGQNYLFTPLGVSYLQSFRHFKLRANLNYYKLSQEAKTRNCSDCYSGIGKVEGLEVKTGVQKAIKSYRSFSFLGGIDLGYSATTYKGKYKGGINGGGYTAHQINHTFILNPYIGLAVIPFRRIMIALESGIYIDSRRTRQVITGKTSKRSEQHLLPLQALTMYWNFR